MGGKAVLMRLILIVFAVVALAGQSAFADVAALEKKVAELEARLSALQAELKEVRKQLEIAKAPALTPQQAIEAFRANPAKPVTVEMRVKWVSWLGWLPKNQAPINFRLTSDAQLENGIFCVDVDGLRSIDLYLPPANRPPPKQPVQLADPNEDRQKPLLDLRGKTIRVTGTIRHSIGKNRPEGGADYYIIDVGSIEEVTVVK
jgi:outer membrane murein-binding lipoprotein Lpp